MHACVHMYVHVITYVVLISLQGNDPYPPVGTTEKSSDTAGPSSAEKIAVSDQIIVIYNMQSSFLDTQV